MTTRRIFVLDTNVLMHDPAAIFRFDEHDIHLPMIVLEELDRRKNGMSEPARNARQASRFIDELIQTNDGEPIDDGLQLPGEFNRNETAVRTGRLFFETTASANREPPASLPGDLPDNSILATTLSLQNAHPGADVTLVSKDINLRIKARIIGIAAENYYNDKTLSDVDLLFSGVSTLPDDFWNNHSKDLDSRIEEDRTFYKVSGPLTASWTPGQFIHMKDGSEFDASVREVSDSDATIELVQNYRTEHQSVWGITARNREQNYVLNMLLDDNLACIIHELMEFIAAVVWAVVLIARRDIAVAMAQGGSAQMAAP